VTHDSREVAPAGCSAACPAVRHDGHQFAATAAAAGASALLVENAPVAVEVPQTGRPRRPPSAMGYVAAAVHGYPPTRLRTIGITGTNGKTTTAHILAAILRGAGLEVRVQGTLSGARTTPEAPDLQRRSSPTGLPTGWRRW
jgi:UDP-N-acetylmuramoyl-L-alanyl-D-glutamate--2,6-diaminopimelate ligase